MPTAKRAIAVALLVLLSTIPASSDRGDPQGTAPDAAAAEFGRLVAETLPRVAALIGLAEPRPVKFEMLSRAQLAQFLATRVEVEYPNQELLKRSRCFAALGLLPAGYDLTAGLIALVQEQAGALYDPRSKTLKGLLDVPPEAKRAVNDVMIVSHELAHAQQDVVIDLVRQSQLGLDNIDYEYALRAVIEGMASAVMLASAQQSSLAQLPDLEAFWRSSFAAARGGTLGHSPEYLRELLISPYAEGGAFIQAWLKANPGRALKDVLEKMPLSSEQVLHFDRYASGDKPEPIDLSAVAKALPAGWTPFFANTLGEFDWLKLFERHPETRSEAAILAAGWDGCRFAASENAKRDVVIVGSSAWDSERDAEEFSGGLSRVLRATRERGDFHVARTGSRVHFVLGLPGRQARESLLATF